VEIKGDVFRRFELYGVDIEEERNERNERNERDERDEKFRSSNKYQAKRRMPDV
jgi:hypothetical protein